MWTLQSAAICCAAGAALSAGTGLRTRCPPAVSAGCTPSGAPAGRRDPGDAGEMLDIQLLAHLQTQATQLGDTAVVEEDGADPPPPDEAGVE